MRGYSEHIGTAFLPVYMKDTVVVVVYWIVEIVTLDICERAMFSLSKRCNGVKPTSSYRQASLMIVATF
jgi:hypothetical protein